MPTNAFGFDDDDQAPEPVDGQATPFAHVEPEAPSPDADEDGWQDPEPSPLEPGEPEAPAAEAPAAADAGAGAGAPEWASRYVGEGRKYADQSALEQGYDNALALAERQAADAWAANQRAEELEAYLRQVLTQATPQAQPQQPQAPQPLDPRIVAAAEQAGLDQSALALVQHLAAAEAESRSATIRAELEAQRYAAAQTAQQTAQQTEQRYAAAQQAQTVATFRAAHPEATPGSELDQQVAFAMTDLDLELSPETLEIAFEAARNPAFWRELRLNPNLIDTDEGLERARRDAGTPASAAPATPAPARTVHVESGGAGLPPASADADEWAVLTLAKQERKRRSPLGI